MLITGLTLSTVYVWIVREINWLIQLKGSLLACFPGEGESATCCSFGQEQAGKSRPRTGRSYAASVSSNAGDEGACRARHTFSRMCVVVNYFSSWPQTSLSRFGWNRRQIVIL